MSFGNFQDSYQLGSASDLAKELGEQGIAKLLAIVCSAYKILQENSLINSEMKEYEITEELVTQVTCVWAESENKPQNIVPINQKSDTACAKKRGKAPTIDFCFRNSWIRETYFGFECKVLEQSDNSLYDKYIVNGLDRYIGGTYCSKGSASSMVGYIKRGDLSIIVKEIKQRVDQDNISKNMSKSNNIGSFEQHFMSSHWRVDGSEICIHHLFLHFNLS
jgi:hypothetical protein